MDYMEKAILLSTTNNPIIYAVFCYTKRFAIIMNSHSQYVPRLSRIRNPRRKIKASLEFRMS